MCPSAREYVLCCSHVLTPLCCVVCLLSVWPHAGKFLSDAIREADTDKDGLVSMEEFTKYYERLAR